MKLTSMFESASETSALKCSQDGENSNQSGALLVPISAESTDIPSSQSKLKDDRSSPVLDIPNGNSDVQADLKKTLEPLSLNNGDGASSDDLERISCRTPVGDNDSSSEKENYLFDDGGSEASLKLRVTESEDEGEMSPRATSPFEDVDQDCSEQALPQTEGHDGTNGESGDIEENCDNEQQENEVSEQDVSSLEVKDEDNETSGKLLRSDEEGGPDTGCAEEKKEEEDCLNAHPESHGSGDCCSAELVQPEKSELCCDIVSDSDTVKCSCNGVCSNTCTCSVLKQEISTKVTPPTESSISLEVDKCTVEHPGTHNEEQSGSLSTSGSHVSLKECSDNNETDFPEECSGSSVLPVSEPTVSESEVTTDIVQNSSVDKENISEEQGTDSETPGDLVVTNALEDEQSCVEKLCSVSGDNSNSVKSALAVREITKRDSCSADGNNDNDEDFISKDQDYVCSVVNTDNKTANSVTSVLAVTENTESDSFSADQNDDDLTSKDKDCSSCVVNPVDKINTLESLPVDSGVVNSLSSAEEEIDSKENVSSVTNNDVKLETDVNVREVCMKNEQGDGDMSDSGSVLPLEESKIAESQNSGTVTDSVPDNPVSLGTDVSQENSELNQNQVEAVGVNVLGDKQADVEMPSTMSQSNINKNISDANAVGKEGLCNGVGDDSIGAVTKAEVVVTKESCSSECDNTAENNEGMLQLDQDSDISTGGSELEVKGRESLVVNMKECETNEVTDNGLKIDEGSVEGQKDVEENVELVKVRNKMSDTENKAVDEMTSSDTQQPPVAEMESRVKSPLPETDVGGRYTEETETGFEKNKTAIRSGDTIGTSNDNCENEEPLTLSDVANALKDAVDTVTLQDGESVPFSGCEASVPPLSSEVHNLPTPDLLISDNTSAMAVHVADQEAQAEIVQEAPGVTEAVRRRRKRSVEDVVQDRISKRTRGASLANSSGANSPEKLVQTTAESVKRSVSDSSVEEDPKRVRLNEEYNKVVKKIEKTVTPNGVVTGEIGSRRLFLEKIRAKDLKGLTVAELEEFFVEKICEVLAYRHEIGMLRQKQQAVENQMEIWRKKTLTMCKQVRDMELVMKRYQNDLKTRKDRPVIPVKVTRSVGLQVHVSDVSSDPSSRALLHKRKRLEQQVSSVNTVQRPNPQSPLTSNTSTVPSSQSASVSTRGTTSSPQYARTATSTNSQTTVPAAGARVPTKPNSGLKTLMPRQQSVSVNTNASATSPTAANSSRAQQMTRSKSAYTAGNSPAGATNKSPRQVIDLTDDGDRGRSAQPRTTAVMTSVNTNTVPANNSVGAPATLTPTSSIRILPQPVTATAVAAGANILATGVTTNNSVPRLTYLVPTSNQLQQRPVLLASSPSQGVPNTVVTVTGGQKNQAPAVYVKNGAVVSVSPIVGSGAVGQQVTTSARPAGLQPSVVQGSPSRPQIRPTQILPGSPQSRSLPQHAQHPAPLPVAPNLNLNNPDLKKMPPRPELKISKQSRHQGIVLSWNMPVTNEYAAIASYQLYAYQESSSPPSTAHWKKVGDVKALPLPMACTLTQFVEGHKYHFAVRAVDIHSRVGPFSLPGSIVLTRK